VPTDMIGRAREPILSLLGDHGGNVA